jgi:hypothetical protein
MTIQTNVDFNSYLLLAARSPSRKRERESSSQEGTPARERTPQHFTNDPELVSDPITPSPVKIFEEIYKSVGLATPASVEALRRAGRCLLDRLDPNSPPEAKKGAEVVKRLFEEILPPNKHQETGAFLKTCQEEINLLRTVRGLGPELSHLQTVESKFDPQSPNRTPVDLPHLLRSEFVATGWHILKPEEAGRLERKVVSSMDVILGGFRCPAGPSGLKYSTFFPSHLIDSPQACADLVQRNHPVATHAQHRLFHDKSTNLWCEGVYNKMGFLATFYPLFFGAVYQEGVSYQILKDGQRVSSADVLDRARRLLRECKEQKLPYEAPTHPLRYWSKDPVTGAQMLYIDLGNALRGILPRSIRGILFQFPKELVLSPSLSPSARQAEPSS